MGGQTKRETDVNIVVYMLMNFRDQFVLRSKTVHINSRNYIGLYFLI